MQHNSPRTFPRIVIKRTTLEPHSRLAHLEPIGIGTPLVESLTSYLCRLAVAHCWKVSTLIGHELRPLLAMPYLFVFPEDSAGIFSSGRSQATLQRMNGISPAAVKFVTALETLTKRQDLRFLTLLNWKHVFTPFCLLRKVKAWCPDCYQEGRASGQTIYDPLLWVIDAVEICSRHQQYLVSHCPQCNNQVSLLRTQSRPGYCHLCEKWLGRLGNSASADYQIIDEPALHFQLWVVKNIGQLLAAAPALKVLPTEENVVKSISAIIDTIYEGVDRRLAQDMGKPKSSICGWKHGKHKPSLIEMIIICYKSRISLLDFLTAEVSIPSEPFALQICTEKKSLKRINTTSGETIDLEAAKLGLTQHLDPSILPLPMTRVSEKIGYCIKTLRKNFPTLCKQISRRFLTYRKEHAKKRRLDLFNEVLSAAFQLHALGQPITRARVATLLNKPEYRNNPKLCVPVREARRQLGK